MKDNEKNINDKENGENEEKQPNYTYFIIALCCFAAGALMFILAFVVKGVSTYFLCASMISELAAVTFLNAQNKRYKCKWVTPVKIGCYVFMAAVLVIMIIAAIVTGAKK